MIITQQLNKFLSHPNRKDASAERFLFILFSLLNLVPLFLVKYSNSLDGPQHLYVSRVIMELLNSNELFEQFFKFNDIIVGNWTGHFLLTTFHLFLPGWIAEKLLLATYLLGIAFSFRYLIFSISKNPSFISFLIFPFSYTVLFHRGYYNFCFGIVVMLLTFGYWLRIENKLSIFRFFAFMLLLALLYLSHFFVFVFFGSSFALYILISFLNKLLYQKNKNEVLKTYLKRVAFALLAFLPAVILAYKYWISFSGYTAYLKLSFVELLRRLYILQSLIGFNTQIEGSENKILFLLLCFLLLFAIVSRVAKRKTSNINDNKLFFKFFIKSDFWLLLTIVFLVLYFIVPDRLSAGSISHRISILLFIFLILWLSAQKFPRLISILTITIIIIHSINTRAYQNKIISEASTMVSELKEIQEVIEPGSLVYSFNYMKDWRQLHFQYYACVDKPILNTAGPQCGPEFYKVTPLVWNLEKRPAVYIGTTNLKNFCTLCSDTNTTLPKITVEYIIVWGAQAYQNIDKTDKVKFILDNYYEKTFTSRHKRGELYKLKVKTNYSAK